MAFRWRADDDLILNAGLVAFSGYPDQYCRKTLYFAIFSGGGGGGGPDPMPPLDPRMKGYRTNPIIVSSLS